MITYDELNNQNDRITQLSSILDKLIDDRAILDMNVTCDLFYQYIDSVSAHLDIIDTNLYTSLLSDSNLQTNNLAKNFMSGSQEIRKIIKKYKKTWCEKAKSAIKIKNHDQFKAETREIFNLVLNRITSETEELYPLVRNVRGDFKVAA